MVKRIIMINYVFKVSYPVFPHTLCYELLQHSEVNTGSLLYKRIDEEIEEHKIS